MTSTSRVALSCLLFFSSAFNCIISLNEHCAFHRWRIVMDREYEERMFISDEDVYVDPITGEFFWSLSRFIGMHVYVVVRIFLLLIICYLFYELFLASLITIGFFSRRMRYQSDTTLHALQSIMYLRWNEARLWIKSHNGTRI